MLFEDSFFSIAHPCEGLFKDKGSKFIAYAFPVNNEMEIKSYLAQLRKEHHSARHHCYAYRLGADKLTVRSNDDGEPSNTAGKPILGQIQSKDLSDILIVVVRYFGGTLLGVSGLINAYKQAAADALNNATIIEKIVKELYEIKFEYLQMNDVMKLIKDEHLEIRSQQLELNCCLVFSVRKNEDIRIQELFSKINNLNIKYINSNANL